MEEERPPAPVTKPERAQLLARADQLAAPELSQAAQLILVAQLRQALTWEPDAQPEKQGEDFGSRPLARLPPALSLSKGVIGGQDAAAVAQLSDFLAQLALAVILVLPLFQHNLSNEEYTPVISRCETLRDILDCSPGK